ncbi:MAG: protein kinase domain-containing protein [Leptolyngbyaceae cyanobacterium]
MRPPLPLQTLLQSRYQILQVLGQGGFGRTYLAQDRSRFNELCALKELIPAQGGEYALEKSKELFQREAQILYQIQHPQIPQFRATFEEEQRLFLVQDYVEGPTYRRILDQRKREGYTFSEGEVRLLLQQLLPVLVHIHGKGVIHRDIAPDNIILRELDQKPVLIDFGVVKELATRLQFMTALSPQPTTVGKPGYAPVEQMQSGQAYPCSDIYSLGVTAIVLLTGREPQELFDNPTLTWHWQRWATVSPLFAQVLNRMIAYRPGDRFQSASEVMQALQVTSPQVATPAPPPPPTPPPTAMPVPVGQTTAVQTLAVGRRPDVVAPSPRPQAVESEPTRVTVWDEPWAVALIGLALVALTGIGSWAIVRAILNHPPAPNPAPTPASPTVTVTPTPPVTPTPTATPTPTPTGPVVYSQKIELTPGMQVSRSGNLQSNEIMNYLVFGSQGQQLTASLGGDGVLMTILAPNRQPFTDNANRVSFWQGDLPFTGDYTIQLRPVQGVDRASYQLNVSLQNPAPPPTPTPTPSPTKPPPEVETIQVTFPPESDQTTVTGRAGPQVIKRYLVGSSKGNILSATISPRDGSLRLTIRYPNGRPVENASGVLQWESEVTRNGEYQIDVIADQDTNFQLDIGLRQIPVPMPR